MTVDANTKATLPARVWVVDDDRAVRFVLAEALRDAGYRVQSFDSAKAALEALESEALPDLVFTDVRMPGMDGLAFLDILKARHPQLPVIVMSAYTDIASTAGAFRAIGRLAQAPIGVLITGETGTGKELVARALHRESPRAGKPFVALNTAAIPAELLESELFGHEAGAFTGANKRHVGRFEQADGGSLFLDEIGDMPAALQTRLLRVLAEGEFFRVGGRELIRVDVRVLAATHQDLDRLVAEGRFRADLLHRLDVVRLKLPPLRERKADIGLLANRFLAEAATRLGSTAKSLHPEAMRRLEQHDWPGNIRELENLCWRLAALAPGDTITLRDLRSLFQPSGSAAASADWTRALTMATEAALARGEPELHAHLRERFDQVVLDAAMQHTGGHRQQAAIALGLGRNTVSRKLGAGRTRKKP